MRQPTPASDEHRRVPGRKDRKRWCKGREGVPHTPQIRLSNRYSRVYTCGLTASKFRSLEADGTRWSCEHEEVCSTCGKRLRWYLTREECPVFIENPHSVFRIEKAPGAPY